MTPRKRTAPSFHTLPTEQRNSRSRQLDQLSTAHVLRLMNREDARAVHAVGRALPCIAQAISQIVRSLRAGGHVFFVGAGTSGRLGVLEAAECPPTFHTKPALVQAIIAGGKSAVFQSKEGAEDRQTDAGRAIRQRVRRGDVVVGIAASGVTPFVDEALRVARRQGARTILLTCNPRATTPVTVRIALSVGPEVLTGSTRLKAGTATKLVLNMLTLGSMVQLGKAYGNLMVDVRPTSRKLRARALRLIQSVAHCDARTAVRCLAAARGRTKVAILMVARGLTVNEAQRHLTRVKDSLRKALA